MAENQSYDAAFNGSEDYQHLLKSVVLINEELTRYQIHLENCTTRMEKSLYKLTHDLYSPLSNVEGLINILKLNNSNVDESTKDIIEMIAEAMVKFKVRIKDVTNVSAIVSCPSTITDFKLTEVLEQVLQKLREPIESTEAVIQTNLVSENNSLCYESNFRIIHNLLNQALKDKSAGTQPKINIKLYKEDVYHVIELVDENSSIAFTELISSPGGEESATVNGIYLIQKIAENAGGGFELQPYNDKGILYKVFFK